MKRGGGAKVVRRLACKSTRRTERAAEQAAVPVSYSGREFRGTVDHLRPEEDLPAIERSQGKGGGETVAWLSWLRFTRQSLQLTEISTGLGRRKEGRRRK